MNFVDRLLTIVVTATLTSALWIIFGGTLIELAGSQEGEQSLRPAEAAPSPEPASEPSPDPIAAATDGATPTPAAAPLDSPTEADETGETLALRIPVLNVRASDLTDTFLDGRGGEGVRRHEAIDIMAPVGTSVVAAAPGTIAKLHSSVAGGNSIYLRTTDRKRIHFYAHLDEYASGLREGQRVRRGQRLGTVGTTGDASEDAPHLHFAILQTTEDAEWWEPANALNPYPLLTKGAPGGAN